MTGSTKAKAAAATAKKAKTAPKPVAKAPLKKQEVRFEIHGHDGYAVVGTSLDPNAARNTARALAEALNRYADAIVV